MIQVNGIFPCAFWNQQEATPELAAVCVVSANRFYQKLEMKGQTLDVYVYVSDYVDIHIDMIIEQDIYSMQIELLILTGHT